MNSGLTPKGKSLVVEALQTLIKSEIAMTDFEKKFKDAQAMVSDNLEQVERLLLKTERTGNPFYDALVYDWVDGWNFVEIDGVIFNFRYYKDDHKIGGFAPIKVVKIENEKEDINSFKLLDGYPTTKIKVLVGPKGSGKTSYAKQITSGHENVWMDGRSPERDFFGKFIYSGVTPATKHIIVDSIPSEKALEHILPTFFNQLIIVNRKGKSPFEMPRPDTILICDFDKYVPLESSVIARIEIIDFGKKEEVDGQSSS